MPREIINQIQPLISMNYFMLASSFDAQVFFIFLSSLKEFRTFTISIIQVFELAFSD